MPNNTDPIRVYQTNAGRIYLPSIFVEAEWDETFQMHLYPAGTRIKEPPTLGAYQAARSLGDGLDADWEVIPNYVGFVYWLEDGSEHRIDEVGVAPPAGHLTEAPPPSAQDFQLMVAAAVNAKLNALAKAWRYTNYISARSYIGDTHPKYDLEARAIANYGSTCFQVLDELEAAVLAGTVTMPTTVEAVLALLPPEPARPSIGG